MTNKVPPNSPPLEGQGWWAGGCFFCLSLVDPKDYIKQAKNDDTYSCYSERSEESLQLAYLLLQCDSSLRSE